MKRVVQAATFGLLLAGAARADIVVSRSALGPMVSASMLLGACTQEDPGIHCDPYVAGVVDSIISNRGVFLGNRICIPPNTSPDSFRAVTVEFIRSHRELPQDANAASMVATAITEAFPCTR